MTDISEWYSSLTKAPNDTQPAKKRKVVPKQKTSDHVPVGCAAGWGERGVRKALEDVEVAAKDLGKHIESVLGKEGYRPEDVKGLLRKHVNSFNKLPFASTKKLSETSMFAIFDGHGGDAVARFSAQWAPLFVAASIIAHTSIKEALLAAFDDLNTVIAEQVREEVLPSMCGATVVVAVLTPKAVYVASLGDCKAVIRRGGAALVLSGKPHRVGNEAERERVLGAGARIVNDRLYGSLAVTRALGDCWAKDMNSKALLGTPAVYGYALGGDDQFIVLGCDGLWDFVDKDEASKFVWQRTTTALEALGQGDFEDFNLPGEHMAYEYPCSSANLRVTARDLCRHAIRNRSSSDNVSAIIILLGSFGQ